VPISGVRATVVILWLLVVVIVNIVLAIGFAYPAALFGMWFVDLDELGTSLVRAMFYLAPTLVPLSEIKGRAGELIRLNPFTGLFESYRDALIYGHHPPVWQVVYPLCFALALLAVFGPLYHREQWHMAKVV
jgi:homopolymeric O-antigen transport system permease protein